MKKMKKVVLAYSGSLPTLMAIKWLEENYCEEVVGILVDVGQSDLEFAKEKAYKMGEVKLYVADAKEEYVKNYVLPGLQAGAIYESYLLLASPFTRPLISKTLVEFAEKQNAEAVAHCCTGESNDRARLEVSIAALNPKLKIIAPLTEWGFTREKKIEYAKKHGITVPVDVDNHYGRDENLCGTSCSGGVLEDPWIEPPKEGVYKWTVSPENAPDKPTYLEIYFEKGVPKSINGEKMSLVNLILNLNKIGGENGVGRVDMIENSLIGIKSREIYECPGATILLKAYQALESLIIPRELSHFKQIISQKYAELVYYGLWFSALKEALDGFVKVIKDKVTGTIKVKLFKGNCVVVGRKSKNSLYDFNLATYDQGDTFNQDFGKGFIELWGLQTKVYSSVNRKNK